MYNIEQVIEQDESIVDNGFEMTPIDDSYEVIKNGNKICTVDFIDKITAKNIDCEIAQESTEEYIVKISDIIDFAECDEYEEKLKAIGFQIG